MGEVEEGGGDRSGERSDGPADLEDFVVAKTEKRRPSSNSVESAGGQAVWRMPLERYVREPVEKANTPRRLVQVGKSDLWIRIASEVRARHDIDGTGPGEEDEAARPSCS